MNTKKNSHYQFTHELIRQTMARLLEKNELKDITVKKLCAVAGINRSTFYAHYESLYDLWADIDSILRVEHIRAFDEANVHFSNYMSLEGLRVALDFVYRYRHFYRWYLERLSTSEYLEALFDEVWAAGPKDTEEQRAAGLYHYLFTLSGAMKVVERWLKCGCRESVDTMAELLTLCIRPQTAGLSLL